MKILKNLSVLLLAIGAMLIIGSSCQGTDTPEQSSCEFAVQYKLDGALVSFQESVITAEIHNDAAIGKFYDIWTDSNGGFYYHSTITETNESAPFNATWFTTNDVGNIVFLNAMSNVNVTFTIEQGAAAVGDQVTIRFSGTYDDSSNVTHTITDGKICTTIDIVN